MSLTTSSTFNPILSVLAHEWWNQGTAWVGHILCPVFRAGEQSGKYPVFSKENFLRRPKNIARAPGTRYTHSGLTLSDDSYHCEDRGHEIFIDDTERKKYRNQFDADTAGIERGLSVVRYAHELEVKALVDATGVPSSTPTTKWDASGSKPIKDVMTQRKAFRDGSGLDLNTMIISRDVAEALWEHADLIDKFKYTKAAVLSAEDISRVFRIPNVYIAGEYQDTGAEGLSSSLSQIWGDDVVLAHTNSGQDLEAPNFGRTMVWTEDSGTEDDIDVVVESRRDDDIRSDIHRVRHNIDVKQTGSTLIRKLTDVLT